MSLRTQSNLWKMAFAVVAIITASICGYQQGSLNEAKYLAHYESDVQQEMAGMPVMDGDR